MTEIAKGGRSAGDDELVRVASAPNPGEAVIIQGVLESRGIESLVRSTGVDGPQIGYGLASQVGQLIFVRSAEVAAARSALAAAMGSAPLEEFPESPADEGAGEYEGGWGRGPRDYTVVGGYARALFWSLVAFALFAALFFGARAL